MFKFWQMVNGDNDKKLEKSLIDGTDALIIDLSKRSKLARSCATDFILANKQTRKAPTLFARISPLAWPESIHELEAIMKSAPYGVALTACENGMDVQQLGTRISVLEAFYGIEVGSTKIIAFVETPRAIVQMHSYKNAGKRLIGLVFDADSLASNMNIESAYEDGKSLSVPLDTARSLVLFGAKSAGILAIETRENAKAIKENGFDGMLVLNDTD